MVYTISWEKQGKRVYTIGPERRVYTVEPQTRKKKKRRVSTVVVYTFFFTVLKCFQCTELPISWTAFSNESLHEVPQFLQFTALSVQQCPGVCSVFSARSPPHPGIYNVFIARRPIFCQEVEHHKDRGSDRGQTIKPKYIFLKLFGHRRDIPAKSRDIPPKKFDFPCFKGHTELFAPHPIHLEDPCPTGKYLDSKVWVCALFSCLK